MNSEDAKAAATDRYREGYLRWQGIAITQLGYSINLFFTLAGATLAFAAKTMMESKAVLPSPPRSLFHASLPALGLSIVAARLCA